MTASQHLPVSILYVDREDTACKSFAHIIETEFDVLTAPNADEAFSVLKNERIDILVTDHSTQGTSGGDLLLEIAQNYPHLVCILVAGDVDKSALLDTLNSTDVFKILEKPLESTQVRRAIRLAANLARDRAIHRQRLLAINETLAFLSHELNTPLATIVNFTHGIKSVIGNPKPMDHLADIDRANSSIQDSALYCLKLLSSLVTSVHHTGNISAESNSNSAIQLVSSMLDTFSLTQRQRTCIQVEKSVDFTVNALPNIVSLVLSYAIGNALKALENRQSPSLFITISAFPSPQICVIDNGPGISQTLIKRLANDPITSHSADGGKGWGLILSTRIMQAIGGCLIVSSEIGKGTTITLRFPAESEYLN